VSVFPEEAGSPHLASVIESDCGTGRLQCLANVDGPAHFATGAPHGRFRPWTHRETSDHGGSVPIANHDNNQHNYNENIRIQNLWDGIELIAALLVM
jgi:hypothetical protein